MKGESRLLTIMFDKDIAATGVLADPIDAPRFNGSGRIVSINARFYAGEENCLLIQPVLKDAQEYEDPLIQTVGDKDKGFISGEDDLFEMSIDTAFQKGDFIRIWAKNISNAIENNVYPIKVWITYYYEGGV